MVILTEFPVYSTMEKPNMGLIKQKSVKGQLYGDFDQNDDIDDNFTNFDTFQNNNFDDEFNDEFNDENDDNNLPDQPTLEHIPEFKSSSFDIHAMPQLLTQNHQKNNKNNHDLQNSDIELDDTNNITNINNINININIPENNETNDHVDSTSIHQRPGTPKRDTKTKTQKINHNRKGTFEKFALSAIDFARKRSNRGISVTKHRDSISVKHEVKKNKTHVVKLSKGDGHRPSIDKFNFKRPSLSKDLFDENENIENENENENNKIDFETLTPIERERIQWTEHIEFDCFINIPYDNMKLEILRDAIIDNFQIEEAQIDKLKITDVTCLNDNNKIRCKTLKELNNIKDNENTNEIDKNNDQRDSNNLDNEIKSHVINDNKDFHKNHGIIKNGDSNSKHSNSQIKSNNHELNSNNNPNPNNNESNHRSNENLNEKSNLANKNDNKTDNGNNNHNINDNQNSSIQNLTILGSQDINSNNENKTLQKSRNSVELSHTPSIERTASLSTKSDENNNNNKIQLKLLDSLSIPNVNSTHTIDVDDGDVYGDDGIELKFRPSISKSKSQSHSDSQSQNINPKNTIPESKKQLTMSQDTVSPSFTPANAPSIESNLTRDSIESEDEKNKEKSIELGTENENENDDDNNKINVNNDRIRELSQIKRAVTKIECKIIAHQYDMHKLTQLIDQVIPKHTLSTKILEHFQKYFNKNKENNIYIEHYNSDNIYITRWRPKLSTEEKYGYSFHTSQFISGSRDTVPMFGPSVMTFHRSAPNRNNNNHPSNLTKSKLNRSSSSSHDSRFFKNFTTTHASRVPSMPVMHARPQLGLRLSRGGSSVLFDDVFENENENENNNSEDLNEIHDWHLTSQIQIDSENETDTQNDKIEKDLHQSTINGFKNKSNKSKNKKDKHKNKNINPNNAPPIMKAPTLTRPGSIPINAGQSGSLSAATSIDDYSDDDDENNQNQQIKGCCIVL